MDTVYRQVCYGSVFLSTEIWSRRRKQKSDEGTAKNGQRWKTRLLRLCSGLVNSRSFFPVLLIAHKIIFTLFLRRLPSSPGGLVLLAPALKRLLSCSGSPFLMTLQHLSVFRKPLFLFKKRSRSSITCDGRRWMAGFYARHFQWVKFCDFGAHLLSIAALPLGG